MRRANSIGRDHPLRRFFAGVVSRRFDADLRLPDPRLAEYVSGLLVDFTHVDSLYRVRDARFRKLADNFELCVFGLNLVKEDLESRQRAYYRGLRETLEG